MADFIKQQRHFHENSAVPLVLGQLVEFRQKRENGGDAILVIAGTKQRPSRKTARFKIRETLKSAAEKLSAAAVQIRACQHNL
ncbi:MAG: hypothetical protein IJ935_00215 [Afipia sp.]|nr:hypothetical protein [Afipia sp.]